MSIDDFTPCSLVVKNHTIQSFPNDYSIEDEVGKFDSILNMYEKCYVILLIKITLKLISKCLANILSLILVMKFV